MTLIKQHDFITSVANALQYISYYHPKDFIDAMSRAYNLEQSPSAKDAIAQILLNSRMSAEGHRPMCQDTGIVTAFVSIGMNTRFEGDMTIQEMIDAGVRKAYLNTDNPLRASVVFPPYGSRKNTGDNAPAVVHIDMVTGDQVDITVAAKGGGSENKSKFIILNPSDSIVDWVVDTIPKLGAGWCPPGMLGIGIGGTAEKAMILAKQSLMESIDMQELIERGPQNSIEELRLEIYTKVNNLGIGAQGLGGLTTVLDVKINQFATHAASLPVALIPNCAATRHLHFVLDGSGPAILPVPQLDDWPEIIRDTTGGKKINLATLTKKDTADWKAGDTLLLSGSILTGRDAAHKRMAELFEKGESLPDGVDFTNKLIYYVGPVDPIDGEAVGPAGPTTATRMDKFTSTMLANTGILGMIGKAERGDQTIAEIKDKKAVYLIAVGGAAYLVSRAIRESRVVAFDDLGMEAIYEFIVEDMPVTVAVDSNGNSVHKTGPAEWKHRIAGIPITVGS